MKIVSSALLIALSSFAIFACVKGNNMENIKTKWQQVAESANGPEEAVQVQKFAEFVRDNSLTLEVKLFDPQTGGQLPIKDLESMPAAPKVQLTLQQKKEKIGSTSPKAPGVKPEKKPKAQTSKHKELFDE